MSVATPLNFANSANGAFRTNPDGSPGGWVDSTATVAATAYLAGSTLAGAAVAAALGALGDLAGAAGWQRRPGRS